MVRKKIYRSNIYKDFRGYARYRSNKKLVHRVVMEKIIGRPLREDERVHHIDGDKMNFKRKNLKLMTKEERLKHHVVKKENVNFSALVEIIKVSIWILRLIIKLIIDIIIYVFRGAKGWRKSK